jgi:uncharacterized protein (DUF1697 family)
MTAFVALLRAVNVGGTGKLPMTELKAMCERAGFSQVRTYIASGNVVFTSPKPEAQVKAALEQRLAAYAGKPVGAMVRTAAELAEVLRCNPFPQAKPNRTIVLFLDAPPAADATTGLKGQKDEEVRLGTRELYIHYGEGMADSKLVVPAAKVGTGRNVNTVAKLVALAAAL